MESTKYHRQRVWYLQVSITDEQKDIKFGIFLFEKNYLSGWRDGQSREPRFSGTLQQLEEIFEGVKNLRPETASEIKDFFDQEKQGESLAVPRRTQKKKTIKQLFTVAGKFQKHLKRLGRIKCVNYA